jgi:putative membrane protein
MSKTPPPGPRRAPQAFDPSDPALIVEPPPAEPIDRPGRRSPTTATGPASLSGEFGDTIHGPDTPARRSAWPSWFTLLIASLTALAGLAASLAFARFVSIVLERSDWIGMTGWSLLALAGLAALVICLREVVGLMRLGRLARLRRDAEAAVVSRNISDERAIVRRLRRTFANRRDLAWAAAEFSKHETDVRDPGDLLALADRELVKPLDMEARRLVLASAKRVSLVTAMSPIAMLAVGFVLVENLKMLRALATLYGGRPGMLGGIRLARLVFVHILATGGIALTDDLIGQFIGQDLARRLSRRLGEGLFNGALTARVGVAALEVCRPLPFIEAAPVRVRDILAELTRRTGSPQRT